MGFEPTTNRLKADCSTTELLTHVYMYSTLASSDVYYVCTIGKLSERLKVSALKADVGKLTEGSNPSLSVNALDQKSHFLLKTYGGV